jgi:DNA polymerase I-like protein with 3'-5' exonuclease and polymerase domains
MPPYGATNGSGMSKHYSNPDQYPMFVPTSNWTPPAILPDLCNESEVALDLETRDDTLANRMGPGWYKGIIRNVGFICGISAAWRDQSIYIPLAHPDTPCFDSEMVRMWLKDLISHKHIKFIFHNFQYDWGWIQAMFDFKPPELIDDTAAMASMLNENLNSFSLDNLCLWQGLQGKDETLLKEAAAAYGIKELKANLWRLPGKFVGPYAEQDAGSTLRLAQKMRPLLTEENLDRAYDIECKLFPVTLEMKRRGIKIDISRTEQLAEMIEKRYLEDLDRMSSSLGQRVSIKEVRSNRWIEEQFNELGLKYPRTPPSESYEDGQASFEKSFLTNHQHWFPRAIYHVRHQADLCNKFLRGYIRDYAHKGRIHATINQFKSEGGGARSHRFSYADPPLQQMPSRDDEYAPLIRSCFCPEPGEIWGALDFNQQEYRLIVHVAELLRARGAKQAGDRYRSDPRTDFHMYVVALTKLERRRAKDTNFAKAYGAGIPKFALMIGTSEEEAKRIYDLYDEELPFVRQASERYSSFAAKHGYIKMIDGARNHFNLWEPQYRDFAREYYAKKENKKIEVFPCSWEEIQVRVNNKDHPWYGERIRRAFTHKAFNRMIQGSAARQTKKAMVDIWQAGYCPLIQMHDELGFSLTNERDGNILKELMCEAVQLTFPVLADLEYGVTWGRAAKRDSYTATFREAWSELK